MADLHDQWRQSIIILHEHNTFKVTFNILLINLAKQVASTSTHAILAFIVPILLTFVQIKFPGSIMSASPFETHQTLTLVSIASLIAYCLAVGARLRFPTHAPTCSRFAMRFFGLLSVSSLLSVLLPGSWHPVPFLIFILYFMGEYACCFGSLRMLCQVAYQRVENGFLCVFGARQRRSTRRLLPLTFRDLRHVQN
ncbi:hypothetical protein CerSpe_083570 [Prunus speciosa]